MREKIPIESLALGMFVDGFDKSWFATPFITHNFLVKKTEQIERLKNSGVKTLFIDTDRGINKNTEADESDLDEIPQIIDDIPKDVKVKTDFKRYNELKESMFEIDRNVFTKGSKIDFELTRKMGLEVETIAPYEDTEIEIDDNIMSSKNELLIRRKDIDKYRKYLEKIFEQRSVEAINLNSIIVRENSKIAIKEIFDDPKNSDTIDKSSKIVLQILNGILDNSLAVSSLLSVNKFDYYLYTHSVNVCVLSIGVALNLGIKNSVELFPLAIGALLHDIGKSTISSDILNRPAARLSELELSIYKQHVHESENLLRLFEDVPEGVFPAVIEHHEKLSGKGYPYGLKENEIHLSGKIVALVNFYDDLTTERPYKKILKPYEALSMIQEQSEHYDIHIFSELIKLLGRT
jgi:HD-GYP domain-containing protein (c-di-GMP phosphodiesterase class II)